MKKLATLTAAAALASIGFVSPAQALNLGMKIMPPQQNLWVGVDFDSGFCEDPDPRTQGFWRRVCKKDHPSVPDRSFLTDELCEDLNPDPPSDSCERARSQSAAVQYNVVSGRLPLSCIVDSTGDFLGDTILQILALIDVGEFGTCILASDIAGGINEGGVSQ